MSDFVPEELLIKIFKRLPIKSLVQFTTVCKSWYSLITSFEFISMHLDRSNEPKISHRILFGKSPTSSGEKEQSVLSCEDHALSYKIEVPFNFSNLLYRLVGSANGLLCIRDDVCLRNPVVIIWNPFIKKSLYVHPPNLDAVVLSWHFWQSFGFGYDHINNDYKVVRIMPFGDGLFSPVVDFYTLSTGKWQDISHLARGFCINGTCVYLNGKLHWVGIVEGGKHGVLSFELSENVFRMMTLPEDILDHVVDPSKVAISIEVYRGFLAVFLFEHDDMTSKLCTWVMKRYGDAESWTKLYNIDLGAPLESLVGIGMDSSILFLDKNQSLVCLDINDSDYEEKIESNGCLRSVKWSSVKVITVVESLVFLDRGREFCDDVTCERMLSDISSSGR